MSAEYSIALGLAANAAPGSMLSRSASQLPRVWPSPALAALYYPALRRRVMVILSVFSFYQLGQRAEAVKCLGWIAQIGSRIDHSGRTATTQTRQNRDSSEDGSIRPVAEGPLLPTLENGSTSWNAVILGKKMPKAIDAIVDAYVKLGDSRSLEGLKAQRLRLAAASRDRTDFDFSLLLGQIDNEIIAIDAGLESLREVPSHPPAE